MSVFDSGLMYDNNQICTKTYSCEDSSKPLHFKFNRFSVEARYDYLAIGLPEEYNENESYWGIVNRDLENVLILDGEQETDIWVNAEAITNFRILFKRKESFFWSIDSNFPSDIIIVTMFELKAWEILMLLCFLF